MAPTLDDTWAKMEWAFGQLQRLVSAVAEFHARPPYERVEERGRDGRRTITAHSPHPVPVEISLLLGDLIHSLHSALDYTVCSLAESTGHPVTRHHAFPIFADEALYDARSPLMLAGVPQPAADLIRSMQPFAEYDPGLFELYTLSIEEKHRALLLANSLVLPRYVAYDKTERTDVQMKVSPRYDRAIVLIEGAEPGASFDVQFESRITLARDGPASMEVEHLGGYLYREVGHVVLARLDWLRLLPLTHRRPLPILFT